MSARPRIEPWPVAVVALLSFMIGSSVAFYRIAAAHPDPLVVRDAYESGRRYSDRVRAERRARDLGWSIELGATPRADGVGVRVALRDRDGTPLAAERVSVRRERPAEGGLDAEFPLAPGSRGFEGTIPLPRAGRWHLVVRAEHAHERAERTFRVRMP